MVNLHTYRSSMNNISIFKFLHIIFHVLCVMKFINHISLPTKLIIDNNLSSQKYKLFLFVLKLLVDCIIILS